MRYRTIMRQLLVVMAAGVLLAPMTADARDWRGGGGDWRGGGGYAPRAQGQPAKKGPGHPQRGGDRDFRRAEGPQRDERQQGGRQQGRMTEEERRELHRDLDRANREIYRQKRGW